MKRRMTIPILLAAFAACAEPPTAAVDSEGTRPSLSASEFSVTPLALRSDSDDLAAWGEAEVFVGILAPPNPCVELLVASTVAVCGVVLNPEAEPITGGVLRIFDAGTRVAALQFLVPPSPCTTYLIRASAAPDLGTSGLSLPAVQMEFTTAVGNLVSVETTPGPPIVGEEFRRGDATVPPNPCLVEFAAGVRSE